MSEQIEDMKQAFTSRGFARYDFKDRYGNDCSLQKSSKADEDCIWLGVDTAFDGTPCKTRMHLTMEQVAIMLPILQGFAETGEPEPTESGYKLVPVNGAFWSDNRPALGDDACREAWKGERLYRMVKA